MNLSPILIPVSLCNTVSRCVKVTVCVLVWCQVREGAMTDLQTQLREVLRENELLRREVGRGAHTFCIYSGKSDP